MNNEPNAEWSIVPLETATTRTRPASAPETTQTLSVTSTTSPALKRAARARLFAASFVAVENAFHDLLTAADIVPTVRTLFALREFLHEQLDASPVDISRHLETGADHEQRPTA